jgi:hypothetical protein
MARFFKLNKDHIIKKSYGNGRIAIALFDPEQGPTATLTVNVPELPLNEGEVFIKDYSENEGVLKDLKQAGLVEVLSEIPYNHVILHRCKWLG